MKRRRLTDRALQGLTRAAPGTRYDVPDVEARGLAVRVNDQGRKTWCLIARFPNSKTSSRLTLGEYPSMGLADARNVARGWRDQIKQGQDPRIERRRDQAGTFAALCEMYFEDMRRRKLRRAGDVERRIRVELIPLWGSRPVTGITKRDVIAMVEGALNRGVTGIAHHLHSYASRVFSFAIERGMIESSPCDRLRPSRLIGAKPARARTLTDAELKALWHADIGYPWTDIIRLLMITGQRRSEVAEMRWRELDLERGIWTVPIERNKAKAVHVVPLVDNALSIIDVLPKFDRGDFVFSTQLGVKPVKGFNKAKQRIDALIRSNEPWVIHDIRRTMRTHLSALAVPDLVRELVIGHTKKGLHKVYDQWAYLDEKRHALMLWRNRLMEIVL